MAEPLRGQVAIVTGGSRGIGLAIATALAAEGVAVALVARSRETVEAAARNILATGARAIALSADVTDQGAVAWIVEETVRQLGPVDLLVNDAGLAAALGPVWDVDPEVWWRDVTTNLRGSFLCARAVLPGNACSASWEDSQRREQFRNSYTPRKQPDALRFRVQ